MLEPQTASVSTFGRTCAQSATCRRADEHEWWRSGGASADAAAAAGMDACRSLPAGGSAFASAAQRPADPPTPTHAVSLDPGAGALGASAAREPWVPPGRRRSAGAGASGEAGPGLAVKLGGAAAAAAAAAAALRAAPAPPRSGLRASATPFTLPPPSPRMGPGSGAVPGFGSAQGLPPQSPRVGPTHAPSPRSAALSSWAADAPTPSPPPPPPALQFELSPLPSVAVLALPLGASATAAGLLVAAEGGAGGRADSAWEDEDDAEAAGRLPVLAVRVPAAAPSPPAAVAAKQAALGAALGEASAAVAQGAGLEPSQRHVAAGTGGAGSIAEDHQGWSPSSSATASLPASGSIHGSDGGAPAPRAGFPPATPAGASPAGPGGAGAGAGAAEAQ